MKFVSLKLKKKIRRRLSLEENRKDVEKAVREVEEPKEVFIETEFSVTKLHPETLDRKADFIRVKFTKVESNAQPVSKKYLANLSTIVRYTRMPRLIWSRRNLRDMRLKYKIASEIPSGFRSISLVPIKYNDLNLKVDRIKSFKLNSLPISVSEQKFDGLQFCKIILSRKPVSVYIDKTVPDFSNIEIRPLMPILSFVKFERIVPSLDTKPCKLLRSVLIYACIHPEVMEKFYIRRRVSLKSDIDEKFIKLMEVIGEVIDLRWLFDGAFTVHPRGPIVVIYKDLENDSTIGFFERLCIQICKEKCCNPYYNVIRSLDEERVRDIDFSLRPKAGYVIRFDVDELEKQDMNLFKRLLKLILDRFAYGNMSFLIFKVSESTFDEVKNVINEVLKKINHPLEVWEVNARKICDTYEQRFSKYMELVQLVLGVDIKGKDIGDKIILPWLDNFYKEAEKIRRIRMDEIAKDMAVSILVEPRKFRGSPEHKIMERIVVKYLLNKMLKAKGLSKCKPDTIQEYIKVEKELSGISSIIPDIWTEDDDGIQVYEIETLFDEEYENVYTLLAYHAKRYAKYKNVKKVKKVHIVLDPVSMFIHCKDLEKALKIIEKFRAIIRLPEIEVFTFKLGKRSIKLIPLNAFIKKLRRICIQETKKK